MVLSSQRQEDQQGLGPSENAAERGKPWFGPREKKQTEIGVQREGRWGQVEWMPQRVECALSVLQLLSLTSGK